MKKSLLTSFLGLFLTLSCFSQLLKKTVDKAYVITRLVDKFHVQPRPIDQRFSADLFSSMLASLDENRIYFLASDIDRLGAFQNILNTLLLDRRADFLTVLTSLFIQRIGQTDSLIKQICETPFDLSHPDSYTLKEDTAFATDVLEQKMKIYKLLKRQSLEELAEYYEIKDGKPLTFLNADSLEATARKKAGHIFHREIQRIEQTQGGIAGFVCQSYLSAVASCFDPHTEFFSLMEKENFQGQLGDRPLQFGFSLYQTRDEVLIAKLKPGSPAYKSGQMNVGDRLLYLQWDAHEPVDVSDATAEEINGMLSMENQGKLSLTLKKSDGSTRKVILQKEKAVLDDDASKVKSFILKGEKTIGFISLPAFYSEWENGRPDGNGCANDVAREIVKLKKGGIDALIMDLRYNGGGSIHEAVELAGIFIDSGPVAMIRDNDQKIYTLKDMSRGAIYDGPLLLLVNGFSASASEMFAAALQDYNRALLVGSTTYGKATAQIVLPLDTTVDPAKMNTERSKDSYLKVTISKLFRVTGSSAQEIGVVPDVQIHDLSEIEPERERAMPYAIPTSTIDPNKGYHPYPLLPVKDLQAYASSFTDTNRYFVALKDFLEQREQSKKDIWLSLKDAVIEHEQDDANLDSRPEAAEAGHPPYEVEWPAYEEERMKTDQDLQASNTRWKELLEEDPSIILCYLVASRMSKN
jgi:carboxyl-terminal processing protease